MKHPISCETWNMKLSRTSLYAPSWALLLSSLTSGTSFLPWLLFRGKKSKTELVFPSTGNRPNVHVNQRAGSRAWCWECLCWGGCWCAAFRTRTLHLGHHQHRARNELFAEDSGCGSGEEKLCDFCKLSSNLHWLLWTLSLPDGTSGFSLVWCAAWWTSASLNFVKALPSASAEAHCDPRLGWPSRGFALHFSWVTALLPEEKGSSKLTHSKQTP